MFLQTDSKTMKANIIIVDGFYYCVEMNFITRKYVRHRIRNVSESIQNFNIKEFIIPSLITNAVIEIYENETNLEKIDTRKS